MRTSALLVSALLVLPLAFPARPARAEEPAPQGWRETFVRCGALTGVAALVGPRSEQSDAFMSASLLFMHWVALRDEADGTAPDAARGKVAREVANRVISLRQQAKDMSSQEATAREIMQANREEAQKCVALFREEGKKRQPAQKE